MVYRYVEKCYCLSKPDYSMVYRKCLNVLCIHELTILQLLHCDRGNLRGQQPYDSGTTCSACPTDAPHCNNGLCDDSSGMCMYAYRYAYAPLLTLPHLNLMPIDRNSQFFYNYITKCVTIALTYIPIVYLYSIPCALYVLTPSLLLQAKEQMEQQRQLVANSPCSVPLALHSSSHLHY